MTRTFFLTLLNLFLARILAVGTMGVWESELLASLTPTPSPWSAAVHCSFMSFLDPFSLPNLIKTKSLNPFHTFSQLLFFKRFPVSLDWTEKKIFSHWPFCEFRPKIEFKQLKKFEMTVKVSETFMLC